jgi:Subtilase family
MATNRILVKAPAGLPSAQVSFGAAAVSFTVAPLFKSIGQDRRGLGAAAGDVWHILTSPVALSDVNAWDVCHSLLRDGFGIAGAAAPTFAEPDLQQQWITGREADLGISLARSCDAPEPQSLDFPQLGNPYWFRDTAHSQFDEADGAIGGPDTPSKVRIAHLDTGYDPAHHSLPKRLRRDLGRNFVDEGDPNDASDQTSGPLTNLGHGTGTLSILAGTGTANQLLGGAPFAEVVPVRVANRVVLFYNSAIAQAFDYVHGLNAAGNDRLDIITMSMGGLASQIWAEAVNALYDQGVFIVTAAGNNFGNLPTHRIVYPARFGRVVAACGVMANHAPYADLGIRLMAGNYGPASKMNTAISAATPNLPWARLGCADIVDFDGAGTSAATPQVAAAAALWLQKNRSAVDACPKKWMRVEAIRTALFDSAQPNPHDIEHLGRGELRARAALDQAPAQASRLRETAADTASFPLFDLLTGLGLQALPKSDQQRMLELEALQLSQSSAIESIMLDGGVPPSRADQRRLAEALAAHPRASKTLRDALGSLLRTEKVSVPVGPPVGGNALEQLHLDHARNPTVPEPTRRPLRVYAYDPSLGAQLETLVINQAIIDIPWERDLKPGPIGEYIEVVDVDPPSQCCYAPVNLNHPYVLLQSGVAPSEAFPQFHQQMAYAVAMKTIEHFERALGRVALWAPHEVTVNGERIPHYVQRLRIYPHALRAKNAYYSPEHKALMLGYFSAGGADVGSALPGGVIFTAVSHDIVAHETTHALLDGLHRRFREPTNPDVFAFHEAFADIVALFQHFTMPEALFHQISETRGDLEKQNLLGKLAVQFGEATGRYGALRDYIGQVVTVRNSRGEEAHTDAIENGDDQGSDVQDGSTAGGAGEKKIWVRRKAQPTDYEDATEPHDRGAVLVAAVFDAFLQIYKRRTADLLRIATGGSGILPKGAISTDLVIRLCNEATKVAGHILNICIRALDYCPPVDVTFGEYLRALITADTDLVPIDKYGYRTAFIEAFRNRGIYPRDVKHLSPGSLIWEPPPLPLRQESVKAILDRLVISWDLNVRREIAYDTSRTNAKKFWDWLMDPGQVAEEEIATLGLIRINEPRADTIGDQPGELRKIEVHSVRPAQRVGPDGNIRSELVVEITQTFRPAAGGRFRGGCTLLIDLPTGVVLYMVRKKVMSTERFASQLGFGLDATDRLHANYFVETDGPREPFALMHRVHG